MKVRRIHITGNAGSGKSTLARALSEKLELPMFGLDEVVWKPGWKKTPQEERRTAEQRLIDKPEWIIEGVSERVREAADVVIFLDRSRLLCLARCLKRNLPYLFHSRPELPENCPEILVVPKLLGIIWRFPRLVGEKILVERSEARDKYIFLCNDKESSEFVASLALK